MFLEPIARLVTTTAQKNSNVSDGLKVTHMVRYKSYNKTKAETSFGQNKSAVLLLTKQ